MIIENGYFWVGGGFVIIGLMTLYFYLRLGYEWMMGLGFGWEWGYNGLINNFVGVVVRLISFIFLPVTLY